MKTTDTILDRSFAIGIAVLVVATIAINLLVIIF